MPTRRKRLSDEIAFNLCRLRIAKGLSQEDLAKKAGTSRGPLARAETGAELPRLSTLESFAKALGVRVRDLLEPIPDTREGAQ